MMDRGGPLRDSLAAEEGPRAGAPASRLHRLIYVSRNRLAGSAGEVEAEVLNILEASRRNNARVGITGALLFSGDLFAQALEGPLAAVQEVFERIQRDERHRDTVVLACEPVSAREFGVWSMAYAGQIESGRYPALALPAAAGAGAQGVLDVLRRVLQPGQAG